MLIYLLVWCYFHTKTFKTPTTKWREVSFKNINKNNTQYIFQQYLCESENEHLQCLILYFHSLQLSCEVWMSLVWFVFRTWTLNHLQRYYSLMRNMTVPCWLMLVMTNPHGCHVLSDILWVQSFSLWQLPASMAPTQFRLHYALRIFGAMMFGI